MSGPSSSSKNLLKFPSQEGRARAKSSGVRELIPSDPKPRPSRLPTPRALFGRSAEVRRVIEGIEAGARLCTILGAPGVGKTRLAEHAAALFVSGAERGRRAFFVDLSNTFTVDELRFAVASAIREPHFADSSESTLREWLVEQGRALLVLDNFEQLTFAATVVEGWTRIAPELAVLVTSRERLAVDGERVLELSPLPCPPARATASEVASSEAVQLFRARAEDAGVRLPDESEAIAEIVRRLDGIPLAIEIAAARTRLLSPAELVARLDRGEDVLTSTSRRANARHRTLDLAIEWSWSLLSPEEQVAFACLSVFPQSFSVSSAEAAVASGRTGLASETISAIDLVTMLREKSLVHTTDDGRLSLYASLREFAKKRFDELDEPLRLRVRAGFVRSLAEIAHAFNLSRLFLDAVPDPKLHRAVRRERDNLVAALSLAATLEPPVGAAAAADLSAALAFLFASPAEVADRALALALERSALLDDSRIAVLRFARQTSLTALGRSEEAQAISDSAASLEDASLGLRMFARMNAGLFLRARGETRASWKVHLAIVEELSEGTAYPRLLGINTACIGRLQCDLGDRDAAILWNQRASEMCDRLGDRWLAALGLANLAQLEQERQSFARAEELLSSALERFRETGEQQYEAVYAATCGGLYFEWGKFDLAREWYETGERAMRPFTVPLPRVLLHGGRAALEAMHGSLDEAIRHLELARRHAAFVTTPISRLLLELHTATVRIARAASEGLPTRDDRLDSLADAGSPDGRIVQANLELRFALRLLNRMRARLESNVEHVRTRLVHHPEAVWFEVGEGSRVMLGRRGSLRRVLLALFAAHRERPGKSTSGEVLVAHGWPDERIRAESSSARLRVTIATLRKLGLRDLLQTRDDGYLIDPEVELVTAVVTTER